MQLFNIIGWKAAGIRDAIGSSYLKPLDPFSSIDPLDQTTEDNIYHQATYPNAEFMQANHDSDDEDE